MSIALGFTIPPEVNKNDHFNVDVVLSKLEHSTEQQVNLADGAPPEASAEQQVDLAGEAPPAASNDQQVDLADYAPPATGGKQLTEARSECSKQEKASAEVQLNHIQPAGQNQIAAPQAPLQQAPTQQQRPPSFFPFNVNRGAPRGCSRGDNFHQRGAQCGRAAPSSQEAWYGQHLRPFAAWLATFATKHQ